MKVIYRLIYTLLAVGTFFQLPAQNAYRIEFELEELRDTVVNLTYFHGANNYYQDTAFVDSEGKFVFEGEEALKEGLYSVIKGNAKLLDLFIVGEQKFSMESELRDLVGEMEVEGNKENEIFYEYLSFLKEKQSIANKLSQSKESLTEGSPEYEKVQKEMDELNEEVSEYIEEFKKKNSKSFTAKFLRSMEYPSLSEKAKKDSVYQLGYIREHLFDNIDFEDERMLRIPSYHEKMMYLMEKLTYPEPDSIIESLEFLLAKAEKNPEIFKYTLAYLTNHYEASKKMGMDAVFVHLAKNYYLQGKAPWVDQKQINKLDERVKALEPLLIGKKAPNIIAKDTAQEEIVNLYDVEAKYTVVYIWSPECGHCKVATPELLEIYHKFKDRGVEVFAVGNEFENKEWLEFIRKHQLDWINVSDGGTFRSNFRSLYDVYSTPQTYLLDENKIILSKKMDMPSLERILEHQLEKDEKKKWKMNSKLPLLIPAVIAIVGISIAFHMTNSNIRLPVYAPTNVNPRLVDPELQYKSRGHFIADFNLVNQDGENFSQKDVEGKIYVADFFFTTCPSICPKMTKQMKRLYDKYLEDPDILLLSHTVQPEVDSVETLKAYAQEQEVESSKWIFLTGDKKQIYDLARKSYFAATTEGDGGVEDFIHTESFVLVDKKGMIRGFYDGTSTEEVDQLMEDIKILRREYES